MAIFVRLDIPSLRKRLPQGLVDQLWRLAREAAGSADDAWGAGLKLERYLKGETELRRLRCSVTFEDRP